MSLGKTVFWSVAVCVLILSGVPAYSQNVAKIGVFDLQRALEESDAGKAAQDEIIKKGKKMKASLEKLGEEIKQIEESLERDLLVMSKDKREEKERDYRIKANDLRTSQKSYLAEMKDLETKYVLRMRDEIYEIVAGIGKKENYLLVVEKTIVVYSPKTIDITDQVIKRYNTWFTKKNK